MRRSLQMTQFSVLTSTNLPNDLAPVKSATLFYASNAGLLSYFGIFEEISRQSNTNSEAALPPHQTAIRGHFFPGTPCMAIV